MRLWATLFLQAKSLGCTMVRPQGREVEEGSALQLLTPSLMGAFTNLLDR